MNKLDAVLIGMVIVSFIIGYFKGFIKEIFGVVSVIISALVTYIYFKSGGSLFSLSLIFIFTNLGLNVAFGALRKLLRQSDPGLSFSYRLGGGAIGVLKGIVLVLIVLSVLHSFSGIIKIIMPGINKYTKTSVLYSRYQKINRAFNRPRLKGAAESFKENPAPVILPSEVVNKLTQNDSVKAILADRQLIEAIRRKDYAKILGNPKFLSLLKNKEFLRQVTALGLWQSRQSVRGNGSSKE